MEKNIKHGRIIIDTSIFTNPEVYQSFGLNPTAALRTFLEIVGKLEGISFYMPPSIYQELFNFIETKDIPPDLQIRIIQKPPKRYELSVRLFYCTNSLKMCATGLTRDCEWPKKLYAKE